MLVAIYRGNYDSAIWSKYNKLLGYLTHNEGIGVNEMAFRSNSCMMLSNKARKIMYDESYILAATMLK